MPMRRLTAVLMVLAVLVGMAPGAMAAVPADPQTESIGRIPPRLSYAQGDVAFWRPGAQDWTPAQVNTPLAPGDELYTGHAGNLELQIGSRAFVRAWGDTQLGLANHEPDFVQIKVTTGHASLDLRAMDAGRTVELDTPHAAFTIERAGYYRVDVTQERTSFITRRAGTAMMMAAGGQPVAVTASQEVVLEGMPAPTARSDVAPELDTWDRWNYARTDSLLDAVSARYVPSGVYGVDDLDHHGNWRVVPDYGAVWVPEAVSAAGWAPYTTGTWIWDPLYGWTWVDTAPWGWAPYHYGRWVSVNGFWAWAPGPLVARPVYAPALVAFFGAPGVRVGIGAPFVSWVALSWGEPVVPWWGRPGFVGRPWWGGWGGPRVVDNVVVNHTTNVNVNTITVYRNVNVQNAVVAVSQEQFGRRAVHETRVTQVDTRQLQPVHGALHVAPDPASFVAASGRAVHPPETTMSRSVVATRPLSPRAVTPRLAAARESGPERDSAQRDSAQGRGNAAVRETLNVPPVGVVSTPRSVPAASTQPQPPFGASSIERPRPPAPLRFEATHPAGVPAAPREFIAPSSGRPETTPTPRAQMPATPRDQTPAPAPAPREHLPAAPRAQAPVAPREPMPIAPRAQAPVTPPAQIPVAPREPAAPPSRPMPQSEPRMEPAHPAGRALPGEPANRLFPGRSQSGFNRSAAHSSEAQVAPSPRPAIATPERAEPGRR